MRPVKLIMQAFGSYGKRTEIDFTKPSQNLFLITGDTGSGKTTIFDAIVFALYGHTSSEGREGKGAMLQSQYADPSAEPYVELLFSEMNAGAEEIYDVRRVPRYSRPKRKTLINESVTLILPDGSDYGQKLKETNEKIVDIVGLTCEQFLQVAMIAQGDFMKMLRASSDERKGIFQRLFGTKRFEDIQSELKRRCRDKESEIAKIHTALQTEAGHILLPEDYSRAQEVKRLREDIVSSPKLSVTDMEDLVTELGALCGWLDESTEQCRRDKKDASGKRDREHDALQSAQQLMKLYNQMETARKELEQCKENESRMQHLQEVADGIRTAWDIKPVWERYNDARLREQKMRKDLDAQKNALPGLKKAFFTAGQEAEAAEAAAKQEAAQCSAIEEKTKQALDNFVKIREAQKAAQESQRQLEAAKAQAEKAAKALEDLERQERQWQEREKELEGADSKMTAHRAKIAQAETIGRDLGDAGMEMTELRRKRQDAGKKAEAYKKASDEFEQASDEYTRIQKQFMDSQAGYLAATLVEGKPCPVCGSRVHPQPCRLSADVSSLTRETVDTLHDKAEKSRQKFQEAASASNAACKLLEEKTDRLEKSLKKLLDRITQESREYSLIQDLCPEAGEKDTPDPDKRIHSARELLDSLQNTYKQWMCLLQRRGERLAADCRELEGLRSSLAGVQTRRAALREDAEKADDNKNKAQVDLGRKQASLESLKVSCTDLGFESEEEAKSRRRTAQDRKKSADERAEEASARREDAKTCREKAEALIARYTAELPALTENADTLQLKYLSLLNDRKMSEEKWKEITAEYEIQKARKYQEEIDAYRNRRTAAESAVRTSRESIAGREKPDMEDLRLRAKEAEEALQKVSARLEELQSIRNTDHHVYRELVPKMDERSAKVSEFTKLDSLYRRLSGNVKNARMDIETFVQRYYLRRILYAANRRFAEMTAGQFELRMLDLDEAGDGKNRGLDLMVYSNVTGRVREVGTLSGGESFMAALSLALGMSDQIRESTSSINLDIMFIDEGFGSLDDNSREQAIRVLQEMAGGRKMIGIISHVTELKMAIEDQLIVTRDDEGSHVNWQIS